MKSSNLLFITLATVACTQHESELPTTYISGRYIDQEEVQTIYVRDYANELGYLHPIYIDSFQTDNNGKFRWSNELSEPKELAFQSDSEFRIIYLEPGDSIYFESDADYYSPATKISGVGSDKIVVLEKLKTLLQFRTIASKDSAEIIPEYLHQVEIYKQIIDSCHTIFSNDFSDYIQSMLVQNKRYVLSILPWFLESNKQIQLEIDTALISKSKSDVFDLSKNEPSNFRFTEDLYYGLARKSEIDSLSPEENLKLFEENLNSMHYSDQYSQQILGMKYLELMEDGKAEILKNPLAQYAKTFPGNQYQQALENEYNAWLAISEGATAPNFTASHVDSTRFEFSHLAGKVVYIDIWATWCGPCVQEIPDSKIIKDHFANNEDLIFLNVSIDSQVDRWKTFLEKHPEMSGINVNDSRDTEAEICLDYKVNGIPRYVLVGRDGKIIDTDAYRPSQKEQLIEQLNQALGIPIKKI